MKVKQLIKELKKMPQDVDVEVALNDNMEYESAGYVCSVFHFVKGDFDVDDMNTESQREFNDMLDECVILRC